MRELTAEKDFQRFFWLTPNQRRDMLIEEACVSKIDYTENQVASFKKIDEDESLSDTDKASKKQSLAWKIESDVMNERFNLIKNLSHAEQARRKSLASTGEFVECKYCRGYHNEVNNNDQLCESCERTVHMHQWDKEYQEKMVFGT